MIGSEVFKHVDEAQNCNLFAYAAEALVHASRLALENDTSAGTPERKEAAVATVLEVVEAMMAVVIDGSEMMERELKCGIWASKEDAA